MIKFVLVGFLGAILGSFAGAQIWRLRARQLMEDKKAGEKVDQKELKKLSPLIKKISKDRSRCLYCGHELKWYDLIPVVSWVAGLGRCRYCKAFIGWTEILLELVMAGLFVASMVFWPGSLTDIWQIALLVLWLASLVLLAILFVYDLRWLLLPDVINIPFIILGAIFAGIKVCLAGDFSKSLDRVDFHQRRHAQGVAFVFAEHQESRAEGFHAAVQGEAVHDGAHAELAHAVVNVVAAFFAGNGDAV